MRRCAILFYVIPLYLRSDILASVRILTSIAPSSNSTHITLRNHSRCTQCSRYGLNSLLWVWPIGVAKTNATIVALMATAVRFLAKTSPFFAVFDNLIAITARKSARKSRSSRFNLVLTTTTTTTDGQTDYFTPCACTRGNNI